MKKFTLCKIITAASLALSFSSVAHAQLKDTQPVSDDVKNLPGKTDVQFFIGQRFWMATWDQAYFDVQMVVPDPFNPVPVLREFNQHALSSTTVLPLTALGIRYKALTVSATYLPQTKFSSSGVAVGDAVRRDEFDFSVGYALTPNLAGSVVYKSGSVDQGSTANATNLTGVSGSYKIEGLLFGLSANAPIKGPLALYGNIAFGPAKETASFNNGNNYVYHGTYQISEIGLAYRLTDNNAILGFQNLSVQLGYRSQTATMNDLPYTTWSVGSVPTPISTQLKTEQSSTQGFVFGVTAVF